jgi:hypothetical protein
MTQLLLGVAASLECHGEGLQDQLAGDRPARIDQPTTRRLNRSRTTRRGLGPADREVQLRVPVVFDGKLGFGHRALPGERPAEN